MKKWKQSFCACIAAGLLCFTGFVEISAEAEYRSPIAALAGFAGITTRELAIARRDTGLSLCALAESYGVYTSFQSEVLEQKRELLSRRVSLGYMTQTEADNFLQQFETQMADCLVDGGNCMGCGIGLGDCAYGDSYTGEQGGYGSGRHHNGRKGHGCHL